MSNIFTIRWPERTRWEESVCFSCQEEADEGSLTGSVDGFRGFALSTFCSLKRKKETRPLCCSTPLLGAVGRLKRSPVTLLFYCFVAPLFDASLYFTPFFFRSLHSSLFVVSFYLSSAVSFFLSVSASVIFFPQPALFVFLSLLVLFSGRLHQLLLSLSPSLDLLLL